MLSADHQPHTLSLLINSGLLALTQTLLRLCGLFMFLHFFFNQFSFCRYCVSAEEGVMCLGLSACIRNNFKT